MPSLPPPPKSPDDEPEAYVGMVAEQAAELARGRGWRTVRQLAPDAIVTMEFMPGRLNFAVRDGAVVRCWRG
ncbi:I78 family peptidase inhibitor [Streptomyces sp. DSM 44915]|uniref:I78 family peptidase inhibitor n=1 Tax=Streptomyces chisholmiae TaxID=3075540 RepID=A0ABU2JYP9_9ACTN|nr:I78 family peptidase inhibitor [Streptomyces sp. DSM 44915]MDT0269859.1 I78 family peptidase inhibitor [Streptomyces sp. DSM 44915]